jgi:integrase
MKTTQGHLFKRGGIYWAQWKHNGKRYRLSTGQTERRKAEMRLRELIEPFALKVKADTLAAIASKVDAASSAIERIENERNPPPLLADLWCTFYDAPNRSDISPGTLRQYEYQVRKFVRWVGEHHPSARTIRDVSRTMAEEFAVYLTQSRASPTTFNRYIMLFQLIWRILKEKSKLTADPWERISRKRLATVSRRELTVEELRTVCRSAKGEMRVLFAIGLFTGLRVGDAGSLKWNEVDLDRGVILRIPNKTARRNPTPVTAPLVPELRVMLTDLHKVGTGEYVLPGISRLLLTNYRKLMRDIHDHFVDCGIQTRGESKGTRMIAPVLVGFHSLRHSFVSICRMGGVPLAVVESVVGHSNVAMTRHYTHVGIEAATRAVASLPNVMTDAPPSQPALPPSDHSLIITQIRKMIEGQSAMNWRDVRQSILALLPASET